MMKNKIFDKKLYVEGLNQLKGTFIISFVIFAASSILLPLLISTDKYTSLNKFVETNYLLVLIPYVISPIFTLSLFSFLFKRKSSDFYHSLNFKRETIFVSFSIAIVTMLTVLVILCSSIALSFTVITDCYTEPGFFYTVIPTILNLIAGSILMTSGITIGCAVSGRLISALGVGLIILFYPRTFIYAITEAFKSANSVIDTKYFDIPLGNSYNALTGSIFDDFSEYKSVVYSVILALIYFIIGTICFKRRKSELAARSSMPKAVQTFFRTAFCMIFCLPACLIIYSEITIYDNGTSIGLIGGTSTIEPFTTCVILWFFAIVAYLLFEIITQRSIKTIPKTILKFGYAVVLNVILIAGLNCAELAVKSYTPNQSSIDSVRFINDADYYYYSYYEEYDFENIKAIESISIKDDEIEKILCEALDKTLNDKKYQYYIGNAYYGRSDDYSDDYFLLTVAFEDGSTKYRNVALTLQEVKQISRLLENNENFLDVATTYPQTIAKCDVTIETDMEYKEFQKETEDVYYAAKEELENVPTHELFSSFFLDSYSDNKVGELFITDSMGNNYIMPVFPEMTETNEKIIELIVTDKNNQENFNETVNVIGKENWLITCYVYKDNNLNSYVAYTLKQDKEAEFIEYIKNNGLKKQENSVIMYLCADKFNEDEEKDEFYSSSSEDTYFSASCCISKDAVKEYLYDYY